MRILLANKFYYRRGGDCVCTINTEELLKAHDHEVAVFAMQHPETLPCKSSKYFPSEIKFKPDLSILETVMRPFGSNEVKKKFIALLNNFKPDVVHLNNIHSQLSPIIAELAHQRGIRIIWTLHDYKLLCPRYDCLRNGNTICEACFTNKSKVLEYKCMKNSKIASFLSYREAMKWTCERLEACTDVFIGPSQFMCDKMKQGGFIASKLHTLCNFIDVTKCSSDDYTKRSDYYCYIGRLNHEKGIKTLIKAANTLPKYKLIIIGGGPLETELKSMASNHIKFVGFKQWDEIKRLVSGARFSVVPSEWYENNPLSIIEAECLGTPVLGAAIGGIPELISKKTGMTFKSHNVEDLQDKIKAMFAHSFDYTAIATASQQRYNAERHYNKLIKIYQEK